MVDQTTDHAGECHIRTRRETVIAVSCILFLQMCERVAYYSIIANMVLFCTSSLDYDTVDATTISLVFSGCVYLLPVLGGYVSDSWAGRFFTVLLSSMLILLGSRNVAYLLSNVARPVVSDHRDQDESQTDMNDSMLEGITLLMVAAVDFSQWIQDNLGFTGRRIFFILGLVFSAVGTGGVKANVSPFGAEQIETLGPQMINSFFNWFYWITAVGSVIAYTGVAYIQQNISFAWGYFAPLVLMLTAMLTYLFAKPAYRMSKPQGSVLKIFFSVLYQGLFKMPKGNESSRFFGSATANKKTNHPLKKHSMLDKARLGHGGDHDDATVDGVYSVIKMLPFCALVIMFWAIYSQTQSSFFIQALRMDVRVGTSKVPAAMLSSFTNLSIVFVIPVLDRIIYPCMSKIGLPMTLLRRIGLGLLFSTLAVVIAGIVEIYRKEYLIIPGGAHIQSLANKNFTASSLTVFAQAPQFMFVGIGEIFTAAATLEAGYTQAPASMQGLLTGLFYASSGIGNLLTLGIMLLVEEVTHADPWWGNEINNTKMENLMFLLAGLMAADFIIFCAIAYSLTLEQNKTTGKDEPAKEI